MATRRNRIKGIANIPVRKKADNIEPTNDAKNCPKTPTFEDKNNLENSERSSETNKDDKHDFTNVSNEEKPKIEQAAKPIILNNLIKPQIGSKDNEKERNLLFRHINIDHKNIPTSENLSSSIVSNKITIHSIQNILNINSCDKPTEKLSNKQLHNIDPYVSESDEEKNVNDTGSTVSQNDYHVAPLSPFKANRSRIKRIPRLGVRNISFSASESEDENKKITDKIKVDNHKLSTSSTNDVGLNDNTLIKNRDFNTVIQRKCKRTDQSRKLAEARRDFSRRFTCGQPDRKKLTMMDLIFYNPTTNLMSTSTKKVEENVDDVQSDRSDNENIEKEIDETTDKTNEEENDGVPVPQIKIGPSGEIIIDEKSLVIENKQLKKDREMIEKSKIIDGNSEQKYGVYKRVKRSKDWTHEETLFFYKALNTLGTDFSTMCQLFPRRTRRELKTKFKKEERINRALIDRAILEPCHYDFRILKKEQEIAEKEQKTLEEIRAQNLKSKDSKRGCLISNIIQKETCSEKINLPIKRIKINSISTTDTKDKEDEKTPASEPKDKMVPKKPIVIRKRKRKNSNSPPLSSSSDLEESDLSDHSSELLNHPVRTRSGRLTKAPQIFDPNPTVPETVPPDLQIVRMKRAPEIKESIPEEIPNSSPCPSENKETEDTGSLMVVSSADPLGRPVYQVYMVTKGTESDNEENKVLKKLITISANEENPHVEALEKENSKLLVNRTCSENKENDLHHVNQDALKKYSECLINQTDSGNNETVMEHDAITSENVIDHDAVASETAVEHDVISSGTVIEHDVTNETVTEHNIIKSETVIDHDAETVIEHDGTNETVTEHNIIKSETVIDHDAETVIEHDVTNETVTKHNIIKSETVIDHDAETVIEHDVINRESDENLHTPLLTIKNPKGEEGVLDSLEQKNINMSAYHIRLEENDLQESKKDKNINSLVLPLNENRTENKTISNDTCLVTNHNEENLS